MAYQVKITEIHVCTVEVEADSLEEAIKKVDEDFTKSPQDYEGCFDIEDTVMEQASNTDRVQKFLED